VYHQLYQAEDMKNWILLENETTVTIFCYSNLVSNIQDTTNKSLNLVTNAGILQTSQKAIVPGWGKVWFNLYAIINIVSYSEMAKRHCITYNSNEEDAFTVYLMDKKVSLQKPIKGYTSISQGSNNQLRLKHNSSTLLMRTRNFSLTINLKELSKQESSIMLSKLLLSKISRQYSA
jgi:hypothetical protein